MNQSFAFPVSGKGDRTSPRVGLAYPYGEAAPMDMVGSDRGRIPFTAAVDVQARER